MANDNRKKYWLVSGLILGLAIIVYLNRAYAHIYDTIGEAGLSPVEQTSSYSIANDVSAASDMTYVALGDSLTAGVGADQPEESLPYLLAKKMAGSDKRVNLKNYAVPGFKSTDLIVSLLPEAIKAEPSVVTLLIGVNDIHNQVSEKDFRRNYQYILDRLMKETSAKIYVINLPFIGADTMMWPPYDLYFRKRTERFNQIIKESADERALTYIDLYSPSVALFQKSGDHYSADLFHPSAYGYKIWADIIYDHINQ
jgi:lysophospholipase L1-like esterase